MTPKAPKAPGTAPATPVATTFDPAAMTPEQRTAAMAALKASAKADKAITRGKVEQCGPAQDDPTVIWIAVRLGNAPGTTGDGRPYLFQADGVEFAANGANWRLNTLYATKA